MEDGGDWTKPKRKKRFEVRVELICSREKLTLQVGLLLPFGEHHCVPVDCVKLGGLVGDDHLAPKIHYAPAHALHLFLQPSHAFHQVFTVCDFDDGDQVCCCESVQREEVLLNK